MLGALLILSITIDSTPIHGTMFVQQHIFYAELYFLGEKNCVKRVDFGQKNQTPSRSIAISVSLAGVGAVLPQV